MSPHSRVGRAIAVIVLALCACRGEKPLAPARPVVGAAAVAATTGQPGGRHALIILLDDLYWALNLDVMMPKSSQWFSTNTVRFTHGYGSHVCCASRAMLLTGLDTHENGVWDNEAPYGGTSFASQEGRTLLTAAQQEGVATACIGKWFNEWRADPRYPFVPKGCDEARLIVEGLEGSGYVARYWNYYLMERGYGSSTFTEVKYGTAQNQYLTSVLGKKAVQFYAARPTGLQTLLYFTPYAPHQKVQTPTRDTNHCRGFPLPVRDSAFNEADVSDQPAFIRVLPRLKPLGVARQDSAQWRQCDALQSVDRVVDSLFTQLQQRGRLDSTLVILASDNSICNGDHRMVNRKHAVFDCAERTPFWVRMPGMSSRTDSTHLVSVLDIRPTAEAWLRIPPSLALDGLDLSPLLADPVAPWRSELLHEVLHVGFDNERADAVRTLDWLYAEYPLASPPETTLYDLRSAAGESRNVVRDTMLRVVRDSLAQRLAHLRVRP